MSDAAPDEALGYPATHSSYAKNYDAARLYALHRCLADQEERAAENFIFNCHFFLKFGAKVRFILNKTKNRPHYLLVSKKKRTFAS